MANSTLRNNAGRVQASPHVSPLERMKCLFEELEDDVPLPCSYQDVNWTRVQTLCEDGYTFDEARIMERLEAYENALLEEAKDAHLASLQPHLRHINDAILKRENGQAAGRAAA